VSDEVYNDFRIAFVTMFEVESRGDSRRRGKLYVRKA